MSDFKTALPYVIQNEGTGYETAPMTDQPTNTGIIADDIARHRNVPLNNITAEDVKNLSIREIEDIYLQLYWNAMRLGEINDQGIATTIFDCGVNRGNRIGIKYAQRACNSLGGGLVVDGQMGLHTLASINTMPRDKFIRHFVTLMEAGYDAIIADHPGDAKYHRGWFSRCNRLLTLI